MRILLVNNRPKERAALKRLLRQDSELCLVGEATGVEGLLAQAQATHPDLLLFDWDLPNLGRAGWLSALHCSDHRLKVVAFGEHAQARQQALAAGVDAFVSKQEPVEQLLNTVREAGRLSPCFV